jgi:hypothetical protein
VPNSGKNYFSAKFAIPFRRRKISASRTDPLRGFSLAVVARSFSGMGLDGYASGIIGRDSWFISCSLLNLPNKKAPDLDGQRLDD